MKSYKVGELSNITGLSRKALRIYEEKGFINPTGYSVGHYKLYDEETVHILQRISVLKFIGFSLEQIGLFLADSETKEIECSLREQKYLLERKRDEYNALIACVDRAIKSCDANELNYDNFASSMHVIIKDRGYDEGIRQLNKYASGPNEWSHWVFDQSGIGSGQNILDLGCGSGNVWRENWHRMPEHIELTCVDKKDSWASLFEERIHQNKMLLLENQKINFLWGDMEHMPLKGSFDRIFLNHVISFLSAPEKMLERIRDLLTDEGVLICTYGDLALFQELIEIIKPIIQITKEHERMFKGQMKQSEARKDMMCSVFSHVEERVYTIYLTFETAQSFYAFIIGKFDVFKKMLPEKAFLTWCEPMFEGGKKVQVQKQTLLFLATK